MQKALFLTLTLTAVALAGCTDTDVNAGTDSTFVTDYNEQEWSEAPKAYEPHVIVAIPDTGINPYHEMYFQEDRAEHPCTYVEDFPCDIEALPLSVGVYDDWEEAYEADAALWVNLTRQVNAAIEAEEPAPFFWIPQTPFVAVSCDPSNVVDNVCLLDDQHMHGTGTTSSVLMENPDALLAFRSHSSATQPFLDRGIPVDIFSVSWGYTLPNTGALGCAGNPHADMEQVFVKSSGNSLVGSPSPGASALADCWSGNPYLISVGGAYAEDDTHETGSYRHMDVVSYYCRPVAQTREVSEMRESYCGTSFSAPTVAGALSKVVLAVRESTGYTGSVNGSMLDPVFGLSKGDLRDAMNLTATYDPEPQYSNAGGSNDAPLNPVAPWAQWGWGFYDGLVADVTIDHLLNDGPVPEKPGAAEHQQAMYDIRMQLYG